MSWGKMLFALGLGAALVIPGNAQEAEMSSAGRAPFGRRGRGGMRSEAMKEKRQAWAQENGVLAEHQAIVAAHQAMRSAREAGDETAIQSARDQLRSAHEAMRATGVEPPEGARRGRRGPSAQNQNPQAATGSEVSFFGLNGTQETSERTTRRRRRPTEEERQARQAKRLAWAQENGVVAEHEAITSARQAIRAARESGDESALEAARLQMHTAKEAMKATGVKPPRRGRRGRRGERERGDQ